jgi:DNA-binding CsgD family transcriptional regulator
MMKSGAPIPRRFTYYEATRRGKAKVTLVRLNKDPVAEFFSGPTVAILIDVMRMEVGDVAGVLVSRHRLTAAEARLAQALERGATIREAASAFGISEGTARYQLKSVFRKVGVTRQAELIRAMHDPRFCGA